jgi:UDP:flavonoid glycosyltransferase YjiC (YdhE family)
VAENVTLAQVVRLVTLAQSLDERHYEVHFACSRFDELVFEHTSFRRWHISTIPRTVVDRALASGRRLYERSTLRRYVQEETRLLAEVRPDLVVGDFRQSLAVSAPLARVPYANLINAYWSPYAVRDAFPLPDHPIVRLLGEPLAARHFPRAVPWFFDYFARPLNDLRREHGLPRIGSLPEVLTYGDYTLYPDTPELAPTRNLPSGHRYLGPVPWSPALEPPGWWSDPQVSRECVYVTLGSSGNIDVLPTIIEALQDLSLTVMLSTAGRATPSGLGRNFRVVE